MFAASYQSQLKGNRVPVDVDANCTAANVSLSILCLQETQRELKTVRNSVRGRFDMKEPRTPLKDKQSQTSPARPQSKSIAHPNPQSKKAQTEGNHIN